MLGAEAVVTVSTKKLIVPRRWFRLECPAIEAPKKIAMGWSVAVFFFGISELSLLTFSKNEIIAFEVRERNP